MQIRVCDICGEEIPGSLDKNEEIRPFLEKNPNGVFNLDYRPVMVDGSGEPIGFDYRNVHICRYCCTAISHAILNEIGRIQESVHKPSVIIPIPKFDTSPVKVGTGSYATPTCGEVPVSG